MRLEPNRELPRTELTPNPELPEGVTVFRAEPVAATFALVPDGFEEGWCAAVEPREDGEEEPEWFPK
jgi:hypothetical protein